MPENEINNQPINGDNAEKSTTPNEENAWSKFERGQISRRAALKKIGITSAMAVFAMFSVDDLARMVGQKMEQRAGDSKIADQIAKEFQQAGIVLASSPSSPCTGNCEGCCTQHAANKANCVTQDNGCVEAGGSPTGCYEDVYLPCMNNANSNFSNCWTNNNCGNCSC